MRNPGTGTPSFVTTNLLLSSNIAHHPLPGERLKAGSEERSHRTVDVKRWGIINLEKILRGKIINLERYYEGKVIITKPQWWELLRQANSKASSKRFAGLEPLVRWRFLAGAERSIAVFCKIPWSNSEEIEVGMLRSTGWPAQYSRIHSLQRTQLPTGLHLSRPNLELFCS